MSRIGKQPVPVPDGVTVTVDGDTVTVSGPKGELVQTMPEGMDIAVADGEVTVVPQGQTRDHRSRHGLVRSLIANMVVGVTEGYSKQLEMVGVGYRAIQQGSNLEVQVGFSHPVIVEAPEGIALSVADTTRISIVGIDKALVGQVAANIRKLRPPEPYKGKGIRYVDEVVRRKAGKAAAR